MKILYTIYANIVYNIMKLQNPYMQPITCLLRVPSLFKQWPPNKRNTRYQPALPFLTTPKLVEQHFRIPSVDYKSHDMCHSERVLWLQKPEEGRMVQPHFVDFYAPNKNAEIYFSKKI